MYICICLYVYIFKDIYIYTYVYVYIIMKVAICLYEQLRDYKYGYTCISNFITPFNISNADFYGIKKIKSIKSIVGISPTIVLPFHLPCFYLKM